MTELTGLRPLPAELNFEEATFHGIPVEDLLYGRHADFLYDEMAAHPAADGFVQECYLGYEPTDNFFVVGYDLNRGSGYQKVVLVPDGEIVHHTNEVFSVGFYDTPYERLHQRYPNLIDLRLD